MDVIRPSVAANVCSARSTAANAISNAAALNMVDVLASVNFRIPIQNILSTQVDCSKDSYDTCLFPTPATRFTIINARYGAHGVRGIKPEPPTDAAWNP